jgi:RNA polymerase sigma-70 factor, ECF subfamily
VSPGTSGDEPAGSRPLSQESTEALLKRLESGESDARDALLSRFLVPLRRWAHGRLPGHARDLMDTDDLVQDTLLRTLKHWSGLGAEGAFMAYMRKTLLNHVKDQIRHTRRQPIREPLEDLYSDGKPSPLDHVIGKETLEKYDAAMLKLPGRMQEAVMLRIELSFDYEEIARCLGSPSPNAARMTVARALLELARIMKVADGKPE